MKKLFKLIFLTLICLVFVGIYQTPKTYCKDLDMINYYEVTVDPVKSDGSLDVHMNISWTVLDDTSEGPLSWVKIGIPNRYVRNIKALSHNIEKIYYYSESGSFIRVDFDREYKANQTIVFEFSFNVYRMYHINENNVYFNYAPGYFDNIRVTKATLWWNTKGVGEIESQNFTIEDGYYKYSSQLSYGQTIGIGVYYPKDYFTTLDEELQYTDAYMTKEDIAAMVIIISIIAIVIVGLIAIAISAQDPYMSNRGFCGRPHYFYYGYYHHHHYYTTGYDKKGGVIVNPSTSGSAGHSSYGGGHCACACACAGGGRAGCSKKDFYKVKVDYLKVKDNLEK